MSRGKLQAVLLATLVVSAISASSAFGAATTTAAQWYTNGSSTPLASGRTYSFSVGGEEKFNKFVLESEVGTTSSKIKITASEGRCVACVIENKEVTSKTGKVAFGHVKLRFEGVTADEPLNCIVENEFGSQGEFSTKELNLHADFMNGTTAVQQFIPTSGETIATFQLAGEACPVAGLYAIKGTLFGDAVNKTGVNASVQPVRFSPAIQTSDGGGLILGTKPAKLTGTGNFDITAETFLVK